MSSIDIKNKMQMQKIAQIIYLNFKKTLDNNLSDKLILSISNLITLDYIHRLKEQNDISQYSIACINRLKNHLGYKVLMLEDFSTSLSLFIIAITSEDTKNINDKFHEQHQDLLINAIILSFYPNLNLEEKDNIRTALKNLLSTMDNMDLFNYINNTPEIFHLTIKSELKNQNNLLNLNHIIQKQIQDTLVQKDNISQKVSKLQNLITKLSLGISVIASTIIGVVISPLLIPLILIPTSILSTKYGPKFSSKIAYTLPSIKKNLVNFNYNKNLLSQSLEQQIDQNVKQTVDDITIQKVKEISTNIDLGVNKNLNKNNDNLNKIEEKNKIYFVLKLI